MDSCLAAWMKPQVFTRTTLASPSEVRSQPAAVSRAASSSESTSLRAQPSVTRLTVRAAGLAGAGLAGAEEEREGTPRAYPGDCVVVPGLKLSVTGVVLFGFWRLPFTVRTTPPGLPSRTFTACFSVHVIEEPAGITPM